MKETFFKQLEIYSNGIIGFNALQGLAFSFYFGSNKMFNCRVISSDMLAETLIFLFTLITILSVISIKFIGKKKAELAVEYKKTLIYITRAKICAVLLFGLFPAFLIYYYGYSAVVPKSCEKLIF